MNGFFPKARLAFLLILWIFPLSLNGNDQLFYLRFVPNLKAADDDLTAGTEGASYKPIFGKGDRNADRLNGVERFGELTVAPGGRSALVSYPRRSRFTTSLKGQVTCITMEEHTP